MTTRTVHIDRSLPALMPSDEAAWRLWLARHGLPDPTDIPCSNVIICDDATRTISFDMRQIGPDGTLVIEHDELGPYIARETVIVQLEAPALPIPPGYQVTVD